MAEETKISWCDYTHNPWIGCTKVSKGPAGACTFCYAERDQDHRYHRVRWGAGRPRYRTGEATLRRPYAWQKRAALFRETFGRWPSVFCLSLGDIFDEEVPPEWRLELWQTVRETPDLRWIFLTKRIRNAPAMLPPDWLENFRHCGLMVSAVTQKEWADDVGFLLLTPASWRGVSAEPLMGPIDATPYLRSFEDEPGLDWVITGGESGPHARPSNPQWFRDLRDQCADFGVPFHFKQWGEWVSVSEVEGPGDTFEFSDHRCVRKVGREKAGRQLDGREILERPPALAA